MLCDGRFVLVLPILNVRVAKLGQPRAAHFVESDQGDLFAFFRAENLELLSDFGPAERQREPRLLGIAKHLVIGRSRDDDRGRAEAVGVRVTQSRFIARDAHGLDRGFDLALIGEHSGGLRYPRFQRG